MRMINLIARHTPYRYLNAFVLLLFMPLSGHAEPHPTVLLRVPEVRQHTVYACGAAALQAILAYYSIDVRQDVLMQKLGTNESEGTKYWEIVRVAREYGLITTTVLQMTRGQLISEINRGMPVLIAIQAWIQNGDPRNIRDWKFRKDDGHYLVAIGYDEKQIYFEDPAMFGIGYIAFDELEARWHDYDQNGNRLDHFAITFEYPKPSARERPLYAPID